MQLRREQRSWKKRESNSDKNSGLIPLFPYIETDKQRSASNLV